MGGTYYAYHTMLSWLGFVAKEMTGLSFCTHCALLIDEFNQHKISEKNRHHLKLLSAWRFGAASSQLFTEVLKLGSYQQSLVIPEIHQTGFEGASFHSLHFTLEVKISRKIIHKVPAKYQYFDDVKKNANKWRKKFFWKKTQVQVGMPKKGLKQVAEANAMHFYSSTSLWCVTWQQSGSSYSKQTPKHLKSSITLTLIKRYGSTS